MARKGKASGGEANFGKPRKDEDPSPSTVYAGKGSNVVKEAEEKKGGGRSKRKSGGFAKISKHNESGKPMGHAKHVGQVKGEQYHADAGAMRRERKSGGRTGSNFSPLSSAHAGTKPSGHKTTAND
jgi:hypothetical protein